MKLKYVRRSAEKILLPIKRLEYNRKTVSMHTYRVVKLGKRSNDERKILVISLLVRILNNNKFIKNLNKSAFNKHKNATTNRMYSHCHKTA